MTLLEVFQSNTQTDACTEQQDLGKASIWLIMLVASDIRLLTRSKRFGDRRLILRDLPELAPVTMTACFPDMLNPAISTLQDPN